MPEARRLCRIRIVRLKPTEYLPHHLIPYPGSDYRQRTVFYLAPEVTLITWEAFAAGRVARDERSAFTRLRSRTEIHRGGVPKARDGLDLPGVSEPFGGYSYSAAVYVLAPRDLGLLAENLHRSLGGVSSARASASVPAPGLCVVRVLADDADALYRALNHVRDTAREALGLPVPARTVW